MFNFGHAVAAARSRERVSVQDTSKVDDTVDWNPHLKTVRIVLDKDLLQATDRAAKKLKRSRSALVRDALRGYLRRLEIRSQEERDRAAYLAVPQDLAEVHMWEGVAAWPED